MHGGVRIIAAASSDLKEKIAAGQFRSDLYYRLNVVPIHVPPLRDRVEDIPVLATHFLQHFAEKYGKQLRQFASAAIRVLEAYPWPGNVRELENVIERAVILAESNTTTLAPEHLPYELSFPDKQYEASTTPLSGNLSTIVTNYEREVLLRVLRHHNWNQTEAARALNLSERMIRYKMKRQKDKIGDLLLRMKEVATELLTPHQINYDFSFPENERVDKLPMEFRRNLYLIYKEALHNISKHSQAPHVDIQLIRSNGLLTLKMAEVSIQRQLIVVRA